MLGQLADRDLAKSLQQALFGIIQQVVWRRTRVARY